MMTMSVRETEPPAGLCGAGESAEIMLDAAPLCCQIVDDEFRTIDCNAAAVKLFGFKDREEFLARVAECRPEYQPDGRRSDDVALAMLEKAFAEGYCIFEWMHRFPGGGPLPSEVTLVKVAYGDGHTVAAYTRDLREQNRMLEEIGRRNSLLQTVNKMSTILLQTDPGRFGGDLFEAMRIMAGEARADRVYIWKNYIRDGKVYCKQLYEWSEGAEPQQGYSLAIETSYSDDVPEWYAKLSLGSAVNGIVREMSANERAALTPQGVLSVLAVPVFLKERFWGFVGFDDCHSERVFSEDEELILRSASQLIANALTRNDDASKAREAEARTRLMLDAMPLCCQLWDSGLRIIDCNEAAVKLHGFARKQEFLERFFECSPERQPDGENSRAKAGMLVQKAFEEGRCSFEWMHRTRGGSPLPAEVTLVRIRYGAGYVVAGYTRDLRHIKTMEKNILHLATKADQIYYDPLTGIYNRRFFDKSMRRLIKALSRSGGVLSLMMLDIDYFKEYNDAYGHLAGDVCIKAIAEILAGSVLRGDDFAVRYGGDEFAVVLPSTGEAGARKVAEKILASVRRRAIPHGNNGGVGRVTVSIGVISGAAKHTLTGKDYIRRADEALYKAKGNGRNGYAFEWM